MNRLKKFPFNSDDILKFIATFFMFIDHYGLYINGEPWLRVIGRLSFPLFAYLYGKHYKKPNSYMLQIGILLVFVEYFYKGHIFLNVLVMFYLFGYLIKFYENMKIGDKIILNVCFVIINPFVLKYLEYGVIGFYFMLIAKEKKLYQYLLVFFYYYFDQGLLFLNIEKNIFLFLILLTECFFTYKEKNINLKFDNLFIKFVARYSLEIYALQYIGFRIIFYINHLQNK
ncbi:MAG: conjugal transfer protein TraX [Rickettsiales bacterium]|jgi:hypothetical protein|nr:conjugal transfer protein TraX [Rickettsiales bacterium]